jgi:hypothetical protein
MIVWLRRVFLCSVVLFAPTASLAETANATPARPLPPFTPSLAPPESGSRSVQVLTPHYLEIAVVVAGPTQTPPDGPIPPPDVPALAPADFSVTVGGEKAVVAEVGFRRRVVYAPLKKRDPRVGNFIVLRLAEPIADNQAVVVGYNGKVPWLAGEKLTARSDPHRLSPVLHVNQVGYAPDHAKIATVGYFLGSLGELPPPAATEFHLVNVRTGEIAHRGSLTPRPERGSPWRWYTKVLEANFSAFRTPGEYRLVVPGLGASYPFFIHEGIPAAFARTYALGFYHQRCGAENTLPFTRFAHAACHLAPVEVPTVPLRTLKGFDETAPDADLYPFVRKGVFDASRGHHDAGDYSKYTINSAGLIHTLVFAVDSLRGVAPLDNLGLPESGDGKSDVLQIAKWEADFLAKMQDDDGGFYFLVYPKNRRYEDDVLPDKGDPQIVWPKNSAATAAAVAALAQCASSPQFKKLYPDEAKRYLAIALRGWDFLVRAEEKHGRGETYRKFTHYGDLFGDADEIAWAACELFLATQEERFEREVRARLDPRNPGQRRWGWRRLTEGYGNAVRSYAFGASSGRVPATKLERLLLKRCEDELIAGAEDWQRATRDSAYLTSYPEATKRVVGGGWFFSTDQAFDMAVAAQLEFPPKADRRPVFRDAVIANLNYEAGTNPVNVSFITGLGWKRPLEIVHQYAQNDHRLLPLAGIPQGSIQDGFTWLWNYKGELGAQSHPLDGAKTAPYPIQDRWGDSFNLQTEFVVTNQARALAVAAWLMAQSPMKAQPWRAAEADIAGVPASVKRGEALKLQFKVPSGFDLADARIIWEGKNQPPVFGHGASFSFKPTEAGEHWVEVEAHWPDGRRLYGVKTFAVMP